MVGDEEEKRSSMMVTKWKDMKNGVGYELTKLGETRWLRVIMMK